MDPEPKLPPDDATTTEEAPETSAPPGRRRWLWPLLLVLAGVAALVVYVLASGPSRAQADKTRAASGAAAQRAVPVAGAPARLGDLGVYQTGLGTVTPLRTVTVRSRVDGELMAVAYREGQLVREGDQLARIDPRPFEVQLHTAEAQLAKDEATLRNARIDLERYKVLSAEDSIPRQQLDTQAATVSQLEAALKGDQAQVESAKLNLTYSRVTAPVSGIVGLRLVDPGNIVHAADPNGLLVITQQQPISVLFTIAADQLPAVLSQTKAGKKLTVEAWDRDLKNKLATGTLLAIDNQIDPATGTVRIKALFANEGLTLYPNQFVNARLLVDTLRGTVLVPVAAIQRSPQATYVYVVRPDSTVEMRIVETRLTEGGDASIRTGLAPGEVVVVDGQDKLQNGTKVSLANGGGGRKKAR